MSSGQTVVVNNWVTENTSIGYISYGDLQTKNITKGNLSKNQMQIQKLSLVHNGSLLLKWINSLISAIIQYQQYRFYSVQEHRYVTSLDIDYINSSSYSYFFVYASANKEDRNKAGVFVC
jgi:hypothetical protein